MEATLRWTPRGWFVSQAETGGLLFRGRFETEEAARGWLESKLPGSKVVSVGEEWGAPRPRLRVRP